MSNSTTKNSFKKLFTHLSTKVSLPLHQAKMMEVAPRSFRWKKIETKAFLKKFKKEYGYIPQSQIFSVISISWSEKGRGFGEYRFWQDGDKIYLDSEHDSKNAVKRILCTMVDQAILQE
jgi:hypothetical protein